MRKGDIVATLRTHAAIILGKIASVLSRGLRLGGGTTFPGTLARRIAPDVLRRLTRPLPRGVVLLTGTNGKTTTARMIASMLQTAGMRVLHNRAGANLVSGLTATALANCDIVGRIRADIGLFETDEAALPQALVETEPCVVIIHNLFRDQLDRYGEVDTLARAWRDALVCLPASSTVLLNADDPAVASLAYGLSANVWTYGMEDERHGTGAASHTADSLFCHQCGTRYTYRLAFYGHIGHYHCPACGLQRPAPQVRLARLDLDGTAGSRLFITAPGDITIDLRFPLPGLYNALNALAAVAAGLAMGLAPSHIRTALENFRAAFGRIEQVQTPAGKPMLIALIKNPVGASETVRMLITRHSEPQEGETLPLTPPPLSAPSPPSPLHLLIAINDRYADGTDVSWLWDADFEPLEGHIASVIASGTRAGDMAVRLKYGTIAPEYITVEPELPRALDRALATLPDGETLFVLPTYTAMLELRNELSRRGWVRPFWET